MPLLTGNNARDNLVPGDDAHLAKALNEAYGGLGPRAQAICGVWDGAIPARDRLLCSASEIRGTDRMIRCPAVMTEINHAAEGARGYAYQVEQTLPGKPAMGSAHSFELPYVFGNLSPEGFLCVGFGPADQALSETMQTYWTNFAETLDPNGAGLPVWPRFEAAARVYIRLSDSGVRVDAGLRAQACSLYGERPWAVKGLEQFA